MSTFSPTWLDLREALDAASRAPLPADLLAHRRADSGPLHIIDLACGTGANLRYLAPRLGGEQHWTLIDNDPVLLAAVPSRLAGWASGAHARFVRERTGAMVLTGPGFECRARTRALDLAGGLEALDVSAVQLVTASALLDLVSMPWLQALAGHCRRLGAGVLFALTYDGRMSFDPAAAGDQQLRELVNRHQRTDKGFGPALGPAAVRTARELFAGLGYRMRAAHSDWRLSPNATALQNALIEGWLDAAVAMAPGAAAQLQAWGRLRRAQIERSRLRVDVGHVDIAGWLP